MTDPVPLYTVGVSGLLQARVGGLLPDMNAAVAAMLGGPQNFPLALFVGNPRAVTGPTIAIAHQADDPGGINLTETARTVRFLLTCLLPHIGSDYPSEFEMARQVAADFLTYLLDGAEMLTPTITLPGGTAQTARAIIASRGTVTDIFPFLMLDRKTTAEGFQLPWSATFSLTRAA